MTLNVGDIFYDTNYYKCYIVSILKDETPAQVVYKYYGKHKQWWHYFVTSEREFDMCFDAGLWTFENKKRGRK